MVRITDCPDTNSVLCGGRIAINQTNKSQLVIYGVMFMCDEPPLSNKIHLLVEPLYEKTGFCICENKDADQLRGDTAKLISVFVFAT